MTIKLWLLESTRELQKAGISSARLDAIILLENELGKPREWIIAHDNTDLSEQQLINLNNNRARRIQREPLAYIIGTKEFYGRSFLVTPDVLIPRPESETMIELLLSFNHQSPTTIFDIGTGSGILAITAKLEEPSSTVIATDISDEALSVAKNNAKTLNANISFIQSDLLTAITNLSRSIMLVNLPYVPKELITSEEITKEPALALFSGEDGLDDYRRFWVQINRHPTKPHCIISESLETQHATMANLALAAGYTLEKTNNLAQQFSLT